MAGAYLLTPAGLYQLLCRRALGEIPVDLAPHFGLTSEQVKRLIYNHKKSFLAICAGLGVEPPKWGGSNRGRRYRTRASDARGYVSRAPVDAAPAPKVIPCLGCQEDHKSTWAGDRLCPRCDKQNHNGGSAGEEFHGIGRAWSGPDLGYV